MDRPKTEKGLLLYGQRKAVNDDGSVRFRFTERKIDRYGDVVIPDGVMLDNYKNNPIALWSHGYEGKMPIGKTDMNSMEITKDYIEANIIFDESSGDEFSKIVANKVRSGFLNACSVGFRGVTVSEEPEIEGQTGYTFLKWELFEISVCAIPALPSALVTNEFAEYRSLCIDKFGKDTVDKMFSRDFQELNEKDEIKKTVADFTAKEIVKEIIKPITEQDEINKSVRILKEARLKGVNIDELLKEEPEPTKEMDHLLGKLQSIYVKTKYQKLGV